MGIFKVSNLLNKTGSHYDRMWSAQDSNIPVVSRRSFIYTRCSLPVSRNLECQLIGILNVHGSFCWSLKYEHWRTWNPVRHANSIFTTVSFWLFQSRVLPICPISAALFKLPVSVILKGATPVKIRTRFIKQN
jgi:hypothetical protein